MAIASESFSLRPAQIIRSVVEGDKFMARRSVLRAALAGALLGATMGAGPGTASEPVDLAPLEALALQLLQARNSHLVSPSNPLSTALLPLSDELRATESTVTQELDTRRQRLSALHERYSGSRTQVEAGDSEAVGATVSMTITETTELDYEKIHGDEPPLTAYRVDHEFGFLRSGDRWTITSADMVVPSGGVAPISAPQSEMDAATDVDSEYDTQPGDGFQESPAPPPGSEFQKLYDYGSDDYTPLPGEQKEMVPVVDAPEADTAGEVPYPDTKPTADSRQPAPASRRPATPTQQRSPPG